MSSILLLLFCVSILASVIFKFSILISLCFGLVIFVSFAILKGFSVKEVFGMCFDGIKTTKNILILLVLLGFLTSLWRSSGTITYIISVSSNLIFPKIFILVTFLLCSLISTLTGTAFGTAATIGSICMTFASSFEINPYWTGGAILSGVYFGNRISPISSIALLTSSVTKTNIYSNIKKMIPSTILPFVISCVIYGLAGIFIQDAKIDVNISEMFEKEFNLNFLCFLPAISILVMSIFKMNVSLTLFSSIIIAFFVSLFSQKIPLVDLLKSLIFGFVPKTQIHGIGGGGFLSMLKVLIIVLIASVYGGIFKKTRMLDFVKEKIQKLAQKTNSFFAILLTSILSSFIVCNQTLTIIITNQLCDTLEDNEKLSLDFFNSSVVVAPLVPWSVAALTALSSASAPIESIAFACFLYLVPIFFALRGKM